MVQWSVKGGLPRQTRQAYGQVSSGRLMTTGVAVLRTTTHRNGSSFEGIDFHVRQEGGDMNEIASLGARDRFSSFAPQRISQMPDRT